MHNVSKLAVSISIAALLSPLALSAKTMEQSYVEQFQGSSSEVPIPLAVVAPSPVGKTEGQVELTFVVNAQGVPTEIAAKSATNDDLVEPVKAAISQWKFAPAVRNGEPVARKVVLPVRFVRAR